MGGGWHSSTRAQWWWASSSVAAGEVRRRSEWQRRACAPPPPPPSPQQPTRVRAAVAAPAAVKRACAQPRIQVGEQVVVAPWSGRGAGGCVSCGQWRAKLMRTSACARLCCVTARCARPSNPPHAPHHPPARWLSVLRSRPAPSANTVWVANESTDRSWIQRSVRLNLRGGGGGGGQPAGLRRRRATPRALRMLQWARSQRKRHAAAGAHLVTSVSEPELTISAWWPLTLLPVGPHLCACGVGGRVGAR